jgi:hypothetical protein
MLEEGRLGQTLPTVHTDATSGEHTLGRGHARLGARGSRAYAKRGIPAYIMAQGSDEGDYRLRSLTLGTR